MKDLETMIKWIEQIPGQYGTKDTLTASLAVLISIHDTYFVGKKKPCSTYALVEGNAIESLSSRETECLFLLIREKSMRKIGCLLFLSPRDHRRAYQ